MNKRDQTQNVRILLTNQAGSFLLLSPDKPASRYEGIFFRIGEKICKTVCFFDHNAKAAHVLNELWRVTRNLGSVQEAYFFAPEQNVLFYELSKPSSFDLVLDCKENFDNRVWGRHYEVFQENDCLVIHFSKKNDQRESPGSEFELYLALYNPGMSFQPLQSWEEQHYEYDERRNSPPYSRWVFRACRLNTKELVLACADDKDKAIELAKSACKAKTAIVKKAEERTASVIKGKQVKEGKPVKDEQVSIAAECARYALCSLRAGDGLFAGLPWFHQYWPRDELVSARALSFIEPVLAKKIILKWLSHLNTIQGPLGKLQADAPGWLFFRAEQMLQEFTGPERAFLGAKLDHYLANIRANLVDGLVVTGPEESWMDTTYNDGGRGGACIEIQALTLAMCRLAQKLSGRMLTLEQQLKKQVLKKFWNNRYLKDRADDPTPRPNVFIAAYVYPELLSKTNWVRCFDYILKRTWLGWGGLASIDKRSQLFTPEHTGENPKSYHRGDSWFWLNNLAAIVLARTDRQKYRAYINHILKASTQEILNLGATGHHSELSSAKELRGEGCFSQAWSSAMFLELVEELF